MKFIGSILTTALIFTLVFSAQTSVFAQQSEGGDEGVETETVEEGEDLPGDGDEGEVGEEAEETEETGEIDEDEVVEESEEVTEEDLSDEIVSGEVVVVTDDVIVIETTDGETVKVDRSSYAVPAGGKWKKKSKNTLSSVQPGQMVRVLPLGVTFVNGTPEVLATYTVSDNVKAFKDGRQISIRDIAEDEVLEIAINEDEEVLGVRVLNQDEEPEAASGGLGTTWIIVIILVILGLVFLVAKKKKKTEVV